jgi:ribulose-phosphate 3-epimerase
LTKQAATKPEALRIAPSVLAADPLHLERDVARLLEAGADLLHLDIMDAHFVPNLSFGPDLVQALRRGFPRTALDVHLMMTHPEDFVDGFQAAGADCLTVHVEIGDKVSDILRDIRAQGMKAGISLKPGTPVETLRQLLPLVDLVLIMTVEPGFGGQPMIVRVLDKAVWLRQTGFMGIISVDGGVTADNARLCLKAGANQLVMGTALFKAVDPAQCIAAIRRMVSA